MNNQRHINLITAYVDGSLTKKQRVEFNRLVDREEIDITKVKEMEALYQQMGELPDAEPSEGMRNRFYQMLNEEKEQQKSADTPVWKKWMESFRSRISVRQLTYALGIFLIGMLVGNWATPFQNYQQEISALSSEVSQMREVVMMSLLDNQSATERLKAVNISSEIQTVDDRVTGTLLKTLNNDPNVNVRLAAVEALVQHASAPRVREGLVASINKQDSPLVQAALADAMLILQEERSVEEFRQLLDQDKVDPGVQDKLKNTIAALS